MEDLSSTLVPQFRNTVYNLSILLHYAISPTALKTQVRHLPEYYHTLLEIRRKCSENRITTVPGFREEAMTKPLWGNPMIAVNGNPLFCLNLARQGYHTFGDLLSINQTFLRGKTLLNYRTIHAAIPQSWWQAFAEGWHQNLPYGNSSCTYSRFLTTQYLCHKQQYGQSIKPFFHLLFRKQLVYRDGEDQILL